MRNNVNGDTVQITCAHPLRVLFSVDCIQGKRIIGASFELQECLKVLNISSGAEEGEVHCAVIYTWKILELGLNPNQHTLLTV